MSNQIISNTKIYFKYFTQWTYRYEWEWLSLVITRTFFRCSSFAVLQILSLLAATFTSKITMPSLLKPVTPLHSLKGNIINERNCKAILKHILYLYASLFEVTYHAAPIEKLKNLWLHKLYIYDYIIKLVFWWHTRMHFCYRVYLTS